MLLETRVSWVTCAKSFALRAPTFAVEGALVSSWPRHQRPGSWKEDLRALDFQAQPRDGVVPGTLAGQNLYEFPNIERDNAAWANLLLQGLAQAQLLRDELRRVNKP